MIPSVTVFVRPSEGCKYNGDETWRRCDCRKHLRWSKDGKQHKRSAKTRPWTQAEDEKRRLEEQFNAGANPKTLETSDRKTLERAVSRIMQPTLLAGSTLRIVRPPRGFTLSSK